MPWAMQFESLSIAKSVWQASRCSHTILINFNSRVIRKSSCKHPGKNVKLKLIKPQIEPIPLSIKVRSPRIIKRKNLYVDIKACNFRDSWSCKSKTFPPNKGANIWVKYRAINNFLEKMLIPENDRRENLRTYIRWIKMIKKIKC